AAA
ncbi:hypothetical protein ECPA23_1476, partial [Escherichia coli PA23]